MSSSGSNFVFIVFREPLFLGVLDFFKSALGGKMHTQPHVTIQGPFSEKITSDRIESIKRQLDGDMMLFANPNYFENKGGAVLYFEVMSQNLRRVWNKPDYPIEIYGFHPHVTVCEDIEIDRAIRAIDFLKREPIELICRDYDIVPYTSKQEELFPRDISPIDDFAVQKLIANGRIGSSFTSRFLAKVRKD